MIGTIRSKGVKSQELQHTVNGRIKPGPEHIQIKTSPDTFF